MAGGVNVLAVMNDCRNDLDAARMGVAAKELAKARDAVAELIEWAGEARSMLAEIDSAVRAEHAKNGHPESKSVAGVVNERLTAALVGAGASV